MVISQKIFKSSLVSLGLAAFSLSVAPQQAQSTAAFRLGQTTTIPNVSAATNYRGQTFSFADGGSFVARTAALVTLQSFSVARATTSATVGASTLVAFLYNTTMGLPTLAQVNTGAGAIATSISSATVDTADFGNLDELIFNFNNVQLSTTGSYGIFLQTNAGVSIRGVSSDLYTTGQAFRASTTTALTPEFNNFRDSIFVVRATAVPFEFEASGGIAILGGLFLANKFRKNKQKVESENKA